jgi:hypothetical protein
VDAGLKGYKTRHNLAALYLQQGRMPEAEYQWRDALAERPDFVPAWLGLGEVYLGQQRWPELEEVLGHLGEVPEAAALRARGQVARPKRTPGITHKRAS